MQSFRALGHRPFALLWLGQTISRLGDSVYKVALAWWVLEKTGSATAMGLVLVFSMFPMLILLLFGGAAVDRYNRRSIMLFSDIFRGVTVAIIAVMASYGILEVWHVFIASFIFGAVNAFFQPAYAATVPEIAPQEIRPSANSLTSLSAQLSNLGGPILGAMLVKLTGTNLAFGINASSFFISALFLLPLLSLKLKPSESKFKPGILKDVRAGIRAVAVMPWLWITILIAAATNVTHSAPVHVALPFLIEKSFGGDVSALGILGSASAIGAVIAALWLGHFTKIHRKGLFAYLAWIISGICLALLGTTPSLPVAVVLMILLGGTIEIFGLIWSIMLQDYVPTEQFGRVASIDYLGSFALLPIGYALVGWLTDLIGPSWVFIAGGSITAILLALGLMHPAIRNLD